MIDDDGPTTQTFLDEGTYTLELSTPFKMYINVDSSIHVYFDSDRTHISLNDSTEVHVGVRSYHTRPAGTITTTSDPADVMAAVSMFGSALKTQSPERSYPTLRGHPPALQLGDELRVPEQFEQPDTGVLIEVPPKLRNIFIVTPLAYYLGASITSGSAPRLRTKSGFSYSLDRNPGFEATVERVLKQVFFLDCIVRTEGTTPVPLHERKAVEPTLEFDLADIYDEPLAEQLEAYLGVPFSILEPHIPEWRLEAHLDPTADSVEFLPFISDSLAAIRVKDNEQNDVNQPQEQIEAIKSFTRGDFVRSADTSRGREHTSSSKHVDQQALATIEQVWRHDRSAQITSTTPLSAFQHNIGREPRDDPIEIEVICNDSEMRKELEEVNGIYGDREELPFQVTEYYDLTSGELEEVLSRDSDFLHYIGHIDEGGFQCADGKLPGTAVEHVGAKAFLLNACQSHDQGLHLVEAGSIGGIVTLGDVINSGAINVGSAIARLLNRGYPLHAALELARKKSLVGQQYRLVGDGTTTIAQSETGYVNVCHLEKNGCRYDISLETYVASVSRKGSIFSPYLEQVKDYFLMPGMIGPFTITIEEMSQYLQLEEMPVITNNKLCWSNDLSVNDL
ncbi:hypothetical protein [Natronosalvus rutilus]|uniref:CHAT domain-containing protein n=1 Tax=Natronosalvus rutilus TaxID=2953753 RepID=A0A9E7ND20_9EURY|nr:hypothetical protein [Natronosalvus rutilus]UTF54710.1 hypothetical protein NGM29_05415 [Natronosalvus rutilus]